jgi:hypothetical protein
LKEQKDRRSAKLSDLKQKQQAEKNKIKESMPKDKYKDAKKSSKWTRYDN